MGHAGSAISERFARRMHCTARCARTQAWRLRVVIADAEVRLNAADWMKASAQVRQVPKALEELGRET